MDLQGNNLRDFLQNNGHVVLQKVDNNSSLRYFTEDELRHITNGYSTLLGKGAFGEVYKGVLENQSTVAVKRYIHGTRKEEFAKEVIVHSQVNHKNVVRLFGCCTEENALMIVMEFISNGNLHNLLHCSYNNGRIPFPLERRLDIAIQVSEVLWCMHSMYSPVLHGDIKPANILLDKYLTPKISDFGIARMISADGSQYTNNVIGSIGYLDPAYCETGILTPKSDVYSFGVVLLEIITRKKAVDGTVILAQCFSEASDNVGNIIHMLDEDICDTTSMKFLEDIGKLAARCLVRDVKMRPEMIEVVISLMMIQKAFLKEQGNLCETNNSALNTSNPLSDDASKGHQLGNLIVFQEEEISRMVKNYGMTSTKGYREGLYHGVFGKDCPVIVRILKTSLETERQMFCNTMSILSQKNHKFIANVVGFYLGNSVSACVYESCCDLSKSVVGLVPTNRNLYDIITSTDKLPLHQRLSISVKCAEGLLHIHSLAAEDPDSYGTSLFGNFRSENIFLVSNYVPKVFNANLSTFIFISAAERNSTTTLGTDNHISEKNYLDPRDVSGQLLNQKSDVYSFGVVLLELMTWKTVIYMFDGRAHLLTADFIDTYRKNRNAIEVFGKVYDERGVCFLHEAIAIAVECLVLDFQKRPELSYVLSRLRIIAEAQNIRSRLIVNNATIPPSIIESTISLNELNEITRNFSNDVLIGRGLLTSVFLGVRKDGQKCAIKKFKFNGLDEDSLVQIQTVSKMPKHDNVLSLHGYFIDGNTCILAYEYAPKGSLYDILHRTKEGVNPLSWMQRVKIAVTAARGCDFFHEKAKPPIMHSNIKSSNIFLFGDDVAKIGDVLPSRKLLEWDSDSTIDDWTTVKGMYRKMTRTYSFGIVLLELLTGRKAFDNTLPGGQQNLVDWARQWLRDRRKMKRCVDPRLAGAYPSKAMAKPLPHRVCNTKRTGGGQARALWRSLSPRSTYPQRRT